jgi:hypothetical protein
MFAGISEVLTASTIRMFIALMVSNTQQTDNFFETAT